LCKKLIIYFINNVTLSHSGDNIFR